MRILYVTPRYGAAIFGGAERLVLDFAERLITRGHEPHILTSCAHSYVDWADVDEPGDSTERGVIVHRLPREIGRSHALFPPVVEGVPGFAATRRYLQDEWNRQSGPALRGAGRWLQRNSGDFDVVAPATYQHRTTWDAAAFSHAPVLLQPTAHPEPTLDVELFATLMRRVDGMALLTPEEHALVEERFPGRSKLTRVVGVGVDALTVTDESVAAFRGGFGLDDLPYLVSVGRIDPGKGHAEAFDFFTAFKQHHPGPLRLVFAGEEIWPVPTHPEVVVTGRLTFDQRNAAMSGALALLQPSWYESFSLVLAEAWRLGTPGIVQGRSAVLRGQAVRSGGAIPYEGFAQFAEAVLLLIRDRPLRDRLGAAGSAYVAANYEWDTVLDRYEALLEDVVSERRSPGA